MTMVIERPMSIPSPALFEELCQTLEEMEVPEGYRAEITGGKIIMSSWSQGYYLDIMESLADQLRPHLPAGHRVSVAPCLYIFPEMSRAFGPDLHVADVQATRIRSPRLPGHALSLVAELTSASTADVDRYDKVECYGVAGVPVYLLVDMQKGSLTVYTAPSAQGYQQQNTVLFGPTVALPAPFDCAIDTAGWEK
ncbi:Uma2 family endonuclease [Streptomyces sp. NPDC059853]|uniref:Uma2 family endonuclease n=1 Tax=Streptomyces sp. NPDC059853 TaxID=3346973 RepID=UPI003655C579